MDQSLILRLAASIQVLFNKEKQKMAQTKPGLSEGIWGTTPNTVDIPTAGKVAVGWTIETPPLEWQNWWQKRTDEMLFHVNEYGVPLWDIDTEYPLYGLANINGVLYRSLIATNSGNDPETDTVNWKLAFVDPSLAIRAINRIVNPAMAVSEQNGFNVMFAGVDTNFYVSDEVFTNTSLASNGGIQRSYQTLEGGQSVRLLVTTATTDLSASNTAGTFGVKLEKSNLSQLDNGDVAVAFKVRTNWSGKLSLAFRNGALTRSYVTDIDVVSGINQVFKVIPFESDTVGSQTLENGTGLVINIGFNNEGALQQGSINNDAWQTGVAYCSDQSTQWTKVLNNYVEVTNRDLYAGNVPREFQPNSYAYDLAECQRYFWSLSGSGTEPLSLTGTMQSTTNAQLFGLFPVEMRDTPVIASSNKLAVSTVGGTLIDMNTPVTSSTKKAIRVSGTTGSVFAANTFIFLRCANDPNSFINFNARL